MNKKNWEGVMRVHKHRNEEVEILKDLDTRGLLAVAGQCHFSFLPLSPSVILRAILLEEVIGVIIELSLSIYYLY